MRDAEEYLKEVDGHIHVMPTDREHFENRDCWCQPELIEETDKGVQVWSHREVQ